MPLRGECDELHLFLSRSHSHNEYTTGRKNIFPSKDADLVKKMYQKQDTHVKREESEIRVMSCVHILFPFLLFFFHPSLTHNIVIIILITFWSSKIPVSSRLPDHSLSLSLRSNLKRDYRLWQSLFSLRALKSCSVSLFWCRWIFILCVFLMKDHRMWWWRRYRHKRKALWLWWWRLWVMITIVWASANAFFRFSVYLQHSPGDGLQVAKPLIIVLLLLPKSTLFSTQGIQSGRQS